MNKFLFSFLTLLPSIALTTTYSNGWSEELYHRGVKSCTASAANKNMQYLITNGYISKDATEAEIKGVREQVTVFQTAVCECVQDKVMKDFHFDDLEKVKEKPAYVKDMMQTCHDKVEKMIKGSELNGADLSQNNGVR